MNNKASNGNGLAELERRLWSAADQLWANSPLRPSEYSTPVLGLIFLRFELRSIRVNCIGIFAPVFMDVHLQSEAHLSQVDHACSRLSVGFGS